MAFIVLCFALSSLVEKHVPWGLSLWEIFYDYILRILASLLDTFSKEGKPEADKYAVRHEIGLGETQVSIQVSKA